MRQQATAINSHRYDYDCDNISRSAILVLLQTLKLKSSLAEKFLDSTETRIHDNSPDSEASGLKFQIQNLRKYAQTGEFLLTT